MQDSVCFLAFSGNVLPTKLMSKLLNTLYMYFHFTKL